MIYMNLLCMDFSYRSFITSAYQMSCTNKFNTKLQSTSLIYKNCKSILPYKHITLFFDIFPCWFVFSYIIVILIYKLVIWGDIPYIIIIKILVFKILFETWLLTNIFIISNCPMLWAGIRTMLNLNSKIEMFSDTPYTTMPKEYKMQIQYLLLLIKTFKDKQTTTLSRLFYLV